jgi:hypothetical protein
MRHCTTTRHSVAASVRAELARTGRSGRWLANEVGWSPANGARKLRGEVPITVDEVVTIAQILDVQITVLVPEPAAVSA